MREALLTLKQVERCFASGEQEVAVLKSLSLTIHAGEMVAIVGASGSGKSTLMNILGCLDRLTRGEYLISGRATRELADEELAALRRRHRAVGNVAAQAIERAEQVGDQPVGRRLGDIGF